MPVQDLQNTQNLQYQPWNPQQGDITHQHVLFDTDAQKQQVQPQELISAGWSTCPRCGESWISPETKAQVEAHGGYYTCPKCRMTSDLLSHLPWHGAVEEGHYHGRSPGGGTSIGIPMRDMGVIAENVVHKMGQIPGYGPITWWSTDYNSPLDGATAEWGIEVKGQAYDAAGHFWDPGRNVAPEFEHTKKIRMAQEMGLQGILGIYVVLNFRTDTADVYAKPMPLDIGGQEGKLVKWHKRTGEKIASAVPFENPLKDPNNPSPGPYSMEEYYNKPVPPGAPQSTPGSEMPF